MNVHELLELGCINARVSRPYGKRGSVGVRNSNFVLRSLPNIAMSCDQWWRIYIDPDKIMHYTPAEVGTLILHEIDHLVLNHFTRAKRAGVTPATAEAWNKGTDCEIDDDLEDENHPFPYRMYFPRDIGAETGQLAEHYYSLFLQQADEDHRPGRLQGGSGDGGDSDGESEQGKPGDDGDQQAGGQDGTGGTGDDICVSSGSGSDGIRRSWEDGEPDGSNAPGVEPAKGERIRMEIARNIRQSSQGKGGWGEWADMMLTPPKTPWDQLLRRAAMGAARRIARGRDDYSYAVRSRRQPWRPYIVPGMIRNSVNITLVLDTSGSMVNDFPRIRGHVEAICKQVGEVSVIQCDSEIKNTSVASTGRLVLVGGGCTDMRSALAQADKDRNTDLIVLITDGDTYWPARRTRHPLIVATTKTSGPSWATTIHIEAA